MHRILPYIVLLLYICVQYTSSLPTTSPSSQPSGKPSRQPSCQPSCQPSTSPTSPSSQPSCQPSSSPTSSPTLHYCHVTPVVYSTLYEFYISTNGSNWNQSCTTNKWFNYGFQTNSPTSSPILSLPSSQPTSSPSRSPQPTLLSLPTYKPTIHPTYSINDPCMQHWYGITCDNSCNIIAISLPSCNLQGTIPSSLGLLRSLNYIDMYYNNITGTIPSTFGNFSNLSYLRLSDNTITGQLPIELLSLHNLSYFYIRYNHISGSLPNHLFNRLPLLTALDLSYNQLSGHFNTTNEISNTLNELNLEGNYLTGSFPNLSNFTSLQSLYIGQNCISSIQNLNTICHLYDLQTLIIDGLSNNCHVKSIIHVRKGSKLPSCIFTTLKNLSQLSISGNYFSGTLPEMSDSALVNVSISDNKLTGNLPISFQKHSFMNFDMSFNRIGGQLLDDYNVSSSITISMFFNRLSGSPPNSLKSTTATVNILRGNVFGCTSYEPTKNTLTTDINHEHFYCGSTAANIVLYIWLIMVLTLAIYVGFSFYIQSASSYQSIRYLLQYKWIDKWRSILIAIKKDLHDWWNVSSYYLLIPKSKWEICVNVDSTLFQTRFTLDLLERISSVAIVLSMLNIFVYLPSYLALKVVSNYQYVLYDDQYFYASTAAYFRGIVPAALTFIYSVVSSICCSLVFVALIPVPKESVTLETTESVAPSYIRTKKKHFLFKSIVRKTIMQLLNAVIAISCNCGYVYLFYFVTTVRYEVVQFTQHLLAVISLLNIFKLAPKLISLQKHRRKELKHQHMIFMNLMYLFVGPAVAIWFLSPWCLGYKFFPKKVYPTYYQTEYVMADNNVNELKTITVEIRNPFEAPWYYSFQCSSSIVTTYFPILCIMYLFLAFFDPLLKLTCMFLSNEGIVTSIKTDIWSRLFIRLTSPIYLYAGTSTMQNLSSSNSQTAGIEMTTFASVIEGRLSGDKKTIQSKRLLNPRVLMTRVCMDIVLLLTFGIVSPVFGLFVTMSIVTNAIVLRLAIGRFLSISKAKGDDIFEINSKRIEDLLRDEWRCLESNWSIIAVFSGLFWYLFIFDYLAEYNAVSGITLGLSMTLLVPAILTYCKRLFTSMNYDIYGDDDDIEITKLSIAENDDNKKKVILTSIKKKVANIHFYIWKRFFGINALSNVIDTGVGQNNGLETISPLAHRTIVRKVQLRSGAITIDQFKASLKAYYTENNPEKVDTLDTIIEAYTSFEQALLDQLEEKYQKPVIIQKKTDVRAKIVEEALKLPKIARISHDEK